MLITQIDRIQFRMFQRTNSIKRLSFPECSKYKYNSFKCCLKTHLNPAHFFYNWPEQRVAIGRKSGLTRLQWHATGTLSLRGVGSHTSVLLSVKCTTRLRGHFIRSYNTTVTVLRNVLRFDAKRFQTGHNNNNNNGLHSTMNRSFHRFENESRFGWSSREKVSPTPQIFQNVSENIRHPCENSLVL